MPNLAPLHHICAYCGQYSFRPDNPEGPGQAYCLHYKKWFRDQMNSERLPAGMRGGECEHWIHMGEIVIERVETKGEK